MSYDPYEFGYGIRSAPSFKLQVSEEELPKFLNAFNKGEPVEVMINELWCGNAYVVEIVVPTELDNTRYADVTLKPTGAPKRRMEDKMKKTKVLNRFYVASDKMMSQAEQGTVNNGPQEHEREHISYRGSAARHQRWAKASLAQAIAHAREILENDPARHEVAVVRIVKVVRRREMPIIVENV